jgi:uncharacterized protein (DUF924 family)
MIGSRATMQPLPPDGDWAENVLDFWFRDLGPEAWFRSDRAIDDLIRKRFTLLHSDLMSRQLLPASAREALAKVIVLDQFSRNLFRGSAEAYAGDDQALETAKALVGAGRDEEFGPTERQFLYMPFQHSEDRADQRRSVELFKKLGRPELIDFAKHHRSLIERFGRFPHRNAILGRASTPEEVEFLRTARSFA